MNKIKTALILGAGGFIGPQLDQARYPGRQQERRDQRAHRPACRQRAAADRLAAFGTLQEHNQDTFAGERFSGAIPGRLREVGRPGIQGLPRP